MRKLKIYNYLSYGELNCDTATRVGRACGKDDEDMGSRVRCIVTPGMDWAYTDRRAAAGMTNPGSSCNT